MNLIKYVKLVRIKKNIYNETLLQFKCEQNFPQKFVLAVLYIKCANIHINYVLFTIIRISNIK